MILTKSVNLNYQIFRNFVYFFVQYCTTIYYYNSYYILSWCNFLLQNYKAVFQLTRTKNDTFDNRQKIRKSSMTTVRFIFPFILSQYHGTIVHVEDVEMSSLFLPGVISAFVNVASSKDISSSFKAARVTKETSGKVRANSETEWRVGALWSCLVWLMWLCLVCCVVSKSTRAWTPPSPWHARWLAMIISPASPPLALSSWGTYSHY